MKPVLFLLLIGITSCSNQGKKESESNKSDSLITLSKPLIKRDTIYSVSQSQKKKDTYKSTLATFWKRSEKEFPFDNWLVELKNNDSINLLKLKVDSFILNTDTTKNNKHQLDTSAQWNLKYYSEEGSYGFMPEQADKRNRFFISKEKKYVLNTSDIFQIFNIHDKLYPLNYFPFIFSRYSRFNSEWTAIMLRDDQLIIRLVSSYPDGNQTSWQFEKIYLFVKYSNFSNQTIIIKS